MMRVKTVKKMLENLQPEDKNQKSIKSYSKSHLFISFEIKRNVWISFNMCYINSMESVNLKKHKVESL